MKNSLTLKFVALSMLVFVGMLKVANAAGISEKDLKMMEKKVEEQSMEHKKLQAQATQISLELGDVSQEMVRAARLIQNNEEKISKMEIELQKLQEELKDAENKFLLEDDNLIRTLAALQNLALKPTEALFVQPMTPVEIIRSAILLRETVPFLEQNAEQIRKDLEKIEAKKMAIEKQYAEISSYKQRLEQEHENMKILVQKKSKIRNAVEIRSEKTKKNVDRLANQAQDLRDFLTKLETERETKRKKQEAERKRIAEAQAAEAKRLEDMKKSEGSKTADLIKLQPDIIKGSGESFVSAKGKIPIPARGTLITSYGEERVKGVSSKGIIIKTRKQAQVIAPFDGSVIFSGPFRGYGNMIIIEHGQGYLSLLAGLENIDVDLGQMLLAGEPVGMMPENDDDAKLYVELRKNNQPIDPMAWMTF